MNNKKKQKEDTGCFESISNMDDLKKYLEKTCSVDNDKNLAEALNITTPTFSRMFSGKKGEYCSPHIDNAEKVVDFCAHREKLSKQLVRKKIYGLFYEPDVLIKKIKEVENREKKYDCESNNEMQDVFLKVKKMIEQTADLMEVKIKDYNRISTFEVGVISEVVWENWTIFSGGRLDSIVGIYLTHKNYIQTMRGLSEIDTCDGMFFLLYDDDTIFDQVLRDKLYKFKNNVLLCHLSEQRTIWVKSFKKKEKYFLKDLLKKENLKFPK